MTDPDEPQEQSPTAHILDELQLYGFGHSRTSPIHAHCPKATVSQVLLPTFSTR